MEVLVRQRDNFSAYLYKCWHQIVFEDRFKSPVKIQMSEKDHYKINTLNLVLIFIESLLARNGEVKIYINLLTQKNLLNLLSTEEREDGYYRDDSKIDLSIYEKAINMITFYISTGFVENLYKNNISVDPGPDSFQVIVNKFKAVPYERKWKHSAKILSLTRVIDTELDQRILSDKVDNITTILYNNLWGRTNSDEAKDAGQMMFELVKNIYQHAPVESKSYSMNNGYASAHVQNAPTLNDPPVDIDFIKDVLSVNSRLRTKWKYLSISINDFGIGIAEKVRRSLMSKINEPKFKIGRFWITEDFIRDDDNLILLAATTDYTTKISDYGAQFFLDKKLSNRGFGYIFCMSFIAKNFGRMEIRSGNKSVLFISKEMAIYNESLKNNQSAVEVLQTSIDDLFTIIVKDLGKIPCSFPGTQTIIEIPVQAPQYSQN